jgi:hypothetical protein
MNEAASSPVCRRLLGQCEPYPVIFTHINALVLTIHPAETNITAAFPRHEITSIRAILPRQAACPRESVTTSRSDFTEWIAGLAMKKPGCGGGIVAMPR